MRQLTDHTIQPHLSHASGSKLVLPTGPGKNIY